MFKENIYGSNCCSTADRQKETAIFAGRN